MRAITLFVLVCPLLLALAPQRHVQAELLGPGKYTGWIVQDRWGDVYLANGVYLLRFHGRAKDKALAWKGKAVDVDVTKIDDGGFLDHVIGGVGAIRARKASHAGVKIELQEPEMCPPMPRQVFDVYVRYEGGAKLRLDTRKLQVLIRRVGPPLPDDATRKGPVFRGRNPRGTPWHAGGSSMTVITPGTRVRHTQVLKAPGGEVEAEGAFSYRASLMLDLPPGAYEVVAFLAGANFSAAPAPRSKVTRLDVVASRK